MARKKRPPPQNARRTRRTRGRAEAGQAPAARFVPRESPAPYVRFGLPGAEENEGAVAQMENALWLPSAIVGALLPDAHTGYGLPIGGVLAVENTVIPYAVGMDIACRMRLSVLDMPEPWLHSRQSLLEHVLQTTTQFGVGGAFRPPLEHPVLEEDWGFSAVLKAHRGRAAEQLGTSGSGNHFVEFGTLEVRESWGGLPAGTYAALLSHSGSRGVGGAVAQHFSRLAMAMQPELPNPLRQLAGFALESAEGQEYWAAMELMGRYSAANHQLIHRRITGALGLGVLEVVENHHNFAWREVVQGRRAVVHRKGATPAGAGVMGVIPGSMIAPGFVVRGKGNPRSLCSASHGAGRRMSRTQARKQGNWHHLRQVLEAHGVTLLGGGLDETPEAYKDIHEVMAAQADLVESIGCFSPKLVKMDT